MRWRTHGRGFWILDDITPLRQLDDKVIAGDAFLFAPELTYRVRWNTNTDTPLPPDVPRRAESAGRGNLKLLLEVFLVRAGHAGDSGCFGQGRATLLQCRSGASAGS